jgi:hypothetical protein
MTAPMIRRRCDRGCLGADSLVETVDGPVAIGTLVGKSMPVLTRLPGGQVGFRLMTGIACTATGVAVLRVGFDNGHAVIVDPGHVFFLRGMAECRADALTIGALLETSFHFPEGYVLRRMDGTTAPSAGAVRVAAVEPAGTADVFTGAVNETQAYFTTAGVLCKA